LKKMRNKNFLLEVLALVEGERAEKYGDSKENHARIAAMWSALLEKEVTANQVYLCLIAVKMSRLMESPRHRDSWLDIAGYAALGEKD
jgi:hypothetical protein|tara:strand:- start:952 stop:1215 length:264 start_codon:yes stop_codon:yes gene_type:complete